MNDTVTLLIMSAGIYGTGALVLFFFCTAYLA